jgi:hypothetical protein
MPQFTATVEAQYADELRETRDRTDAEIVRGYLQPISAKRIAKDRAVAAISRNNWVREAVQSAISRTCMDAHDAGHTLDDMSVTVAVSDLVATATLTLPEGN